MAKRERFVRYTVEQLKAMESKTDWARVDATTEAEIEAQALEDEGPLLEGWEKTIFSGLPGTTQRVHIQIDQSVIQWFKAGGRGYQARINDVLRSFVDEQERDKRRAG